MSLSRAVECDRCPRAAVVDRPYAADHLCDAHLAETIRDRFQRSLRRQLPRFRGRTVAVALSGGKDSAVALSLTHAYFARRPATEVVAITVDEGIRGYRPKTIRSAKALTKSLGVRHVVVRAEKELGTTTDAAALRMVGTPPCSYCGVWRRQLLNRAARDAGADALVLGFNLDDLAQTVLMNVARGDVSRLGRMAPHTVRQEGLVPRVAPLAEVPEREVYLHARASGLPFDHAECPFAHRASRNVFREAVWQMEEALPGTRQSLLRSRETIVHLLESMGTITGAPQRCAECGEPSTGALCRACEYRRAVSAPIMGVAVS
jgi:uncharacterized protein (TIGR00269 family)